DVDAAGDHGRERRSAAFGIENLDVEAELLEVALLKAHVDECAVPETALRDRDLQGFGSGGFRDRNGHQAERDSQYRLHGVLRDWFPDAVQRECAARSGALRSGYTASILLDVLLAHHAAPARELIAEDFPELGAGCRRRYGARMQQLLAHVRSIDHGD